MKFESLSDAYERAERKWGSGLGGKRALAFGGETLSMATSESPKLCTCAEDSEFVLEFSHVLLLQEVHGQ